MLELEVDSIEKAKSCYNNAISLGATDEGALGPRGTDGLYAGYFKDLDCHKLNVFTLIEK
jgi:predicted lactoylglutathione lyase